METAHKTDLEKKIEEAEHTVAQMHAKVEQLDTVLGKADQALLGAERLGERARKAAPKARLAAIIAGMFAAAALASWLARRRPAPAL